MRTTGSYTFEAGPLPCVLEIAVGPNAGTALTVTGVAAQQARGGQCQIAYTLSTDASVDIEIVNIAGRPVRRIYTARDQSAGTNSVVWNACSDTGVTVPSGRYLVKIAARAPDGQQTQGIAPLTIGR